MRIGWSFLMAVEVPTTGEHLWRVVPRQPPGNPRAYYRPRPKVVRTFTDLQKSVAEMLAFAFTHGEAVEVVTLE